MDSVADLAGILGRMDLDFENFHFSGSQMFGLHFPWWAKCPYCKPGHPDLGKSGNPDVGKIQIVGTWKAGSLES